MRALALALCLIGGPALAEGPTMRALQTVQDGKGWQAVGRIELGDRGFCTGALIADDLVLTAAHCLFDKETGARIADGDLRFLAGWRNGRAEAYRNVARALPHPGYRFDVGEDLVNVGVDLALLRLDQPIRLPQVAPFATDWSPLMGEEVGIVSYAMDRSEAPSLQEVCEVMAQRTDLMVLSCAVEFGASGAPVFVLRDGEVRIVSVVSAKAAVEGRPVALAVPLMEPLATLQAEMAAGAPRAAPGPKVLSGGSGGAKFIKVAP
ncbi:trypsin-like serine peptidase [Paragemmobacter ruber]|uniref:Serine protease n=1 Tax=Paragemmobacter ruber TaxID=1985673 RepID=A0ABW9Y6Z0_9RHOB|nr:trypsin-like peptidase domain-containing protein [Rhodobacter ruber]NBE07642.1 trypsin-like serine protease [Rhodobacter ruber]